MRTAGCRRQCETSSHPMKARSCVVSYSRSRRGLTVGAAGLTDWMQPTKTVNEAVRTTLTFGSIVTNSGATAKAATNTPNMRALALSSVGNGSRRISTLFQRRSTKDTVHRLLKLNPPTIIRCDLVISWRTDPPTLRWMRFLASTSSLSNLSFLCG